MKILNEIHTLIHSLNKKEKQLFTQLAGLSGDRKDKRYYQLFQLLAEMPVFDEVLLKESFLSKISAKQIADDKQYLAEKLIAVLNLRDKNTNDKVQISKHIARAFILRTYNAHHLALKEIEKGLELAYKENALSFIYLMTEFKYGIQGIIDKDVDFKEINRELERTLDKMQRVQLIGKYTIELRELIQSKTRQSESEFKIALERLISSWEDLKLGHLENDTIEFMELNLKIGFYMSSENYSMAYESAKRGIEIIEKDILKEQIACYSLLTYLSNIISFSLKLNNEANARVYLGKLFDFAELVKIHNNKSLCQEVEFTYLQLRLEIEFILRNYELVAAEMSHVLLVLRNHSQFVRSGIISVIRVAWSLVYLNNYKNAYFLTQKELTIKETKENYEFNLAYYILKSIIEIKTSDLFTAENTLRNLTRYIKLNSTDRELDNHIYKLLNAYLSYRTGKGSKLKIQRQYEKMNIKYDNISMMGLIRFFQYEDVI